MEGKRRIISLGINIDHVATLRNARGENDPALIELALVAQNAGADLITVHLREDRRHIRDADIFDLIKNLKIPLNFEMALSDEILKIALEAKPTTACIVPERREEITTEGGLDVVKHLTRVTQFVKQLHLAGTETFLFIEPDEAALDAAKESGAQGIEFHTGAYARSFTNAPRRRHELERLKRAAKHAARLGLEVHAGHGLNYHNVEFVCAIEEITELNIGHAVIARSLRTGLATAIHDMRAAMDKAR
ncbi:MAG: pyridoxine 5'-phosphate synthase [Spirochaetota bacterium]